MGHQNRLLRRGGNWTFRARVPDRLRPIIGKKEIWKSFGSVTHAEAARLARIESVRVDALFAEAEERLAEATLRPLNAVTDAELAQIAREYFFRLESGAAPASFSEGERLDRQRANEEDAAAVGATLEDAGLQSVALSIGREARLATEASVAGFMRLVEAVQRAMIEHHNRDADRAALLPVRTIDPLFDGVSADLPPAVACDALTLSKAIELFKAAPERANVATKTRAAYDFRYDMLAALLGAERSVAEVSRADMREAQALLLRLPPNALKRFPDMKLQRVATLAEEKGIAPMSPKSVMLYLHAANALWRWLVAEELAPKNPAAGIKGPSLPDETARRPFAVAELNRLFAAKDFNGSAGQSWLYWLPRVALFTGARFAELLALRASDVIEADGVTVLSIAPNADRKLKNKGSRRLVPVHPELVKLGLLDHTARVGASGLLFPDAAGPKSMLNARNKEIGRKLRAVLPDEALVFHSFRHTFKDAGGRARIARELLAAIGGWEVGGKAAIDDYGRDPLVKILAEEIAKVRFDGLVP